MVGSVGGTDRRDTGNFTDWTMRPIFILGASSPWGTMRTTSVPHQGFLASRNSRI